MNWDDSPDPVWKDVWMPVEILEEYPTWMLAEVKQHLNPNGGFKGSKPYKIGINKMNLLFGGIKLKEGRSS